MRSLASHISQEGRWKERTKGVRYSIFQADNINDNGGGKEDFYSEMSE